jgi:hypothetical protein
VQRGKGRKIEITITKQTQFMNTNTIQIPIPNGFQIENFDLKTGKVTLKETPKEVTERIKTINDVLADNDLTQESFDRLVGNLEEDEKAYILIKMLAKSLNEGWTPDWNNSNQTKYFVWFEMGGSSGFRYDDCGSWRSASSVGSRLCFKTSKLAEYAAKQFTEVYKQFMLIN